MSGDIIDMMPHLRLKARNKCKHIRGCSVDPRAASLTCDDCGIEIDPWVYIRWIANDTLDLERHRDAVTASIDAKITAGNAAIATLNEEITRLSKFKAELYNERLPNGVLLGTEMRKAELRRTRSKR